MAAALSSSIRCSVLRISIPAYGIESTITRGSCFSMRAFPLMSVPAGPDAALDARVDGELLNERITSVLEKIHPRYRRAIEFRFLKEMGRVECAEAMEVKVGTFDVLVLRALKAFRKQWEASGE